MIEAPRNARIDPPSSTKRGARRGELGTRFFSFAAHVLLFDTHTFDMRDPHGTTADVPSLISLSST